MESIWFSLTFGNISNVDFDLTFVDFDCLPFYTPLLFLRRLPSNKNQNSQKVMSCFKTNLLNSVFHSIFQEVSRKQTLSSFLSIFPVKLKHQIMHYYHIIVYYFSFLIYLYLFLFFTQNVVNRYSSLRAYYRYWKFFNAFK